MPASHRIDRDMRVVHTRAWGTVTYDDLVGNRAAIATDPSYEPGMRQLFDFSEVTEASLSSSRIRDLALVPPPTGSVHRVAIVVATTELYGLARMFALTGDRSEEEFRIFRTREDALLWLGLPPARAG